MFHNRAEGTTIFVRSAVFILDALFCFSFSLFLIKTFLAFGLFVVVVGRTFGPFTFNSFALELFREARLSVYFLCVAL